MNDLTRAVDAPVLGRQPRRTGASQSNEGGVRTILRASHRDKLLAGIVVVFYVAMMVISFQAPAPHGDEQSIHFPNAVKFAAEFPHFNLLDDYSSANTPLPYLLAALPLRFFGENLMYARMLTALISLLLVYVWWLLARAMELRRHAWIGLGLLLLNPYFITNSFVFYVTLYGILFSLLAFYFFLRPGLTSSALASFALMLSLLSHQWALAFYVAMVSWWVVRFLLLHRNSRSEARDLVLKLAFTGASLIPASLVFLTWRGLTHPTIAGLAGGLQPTNLSFFGVALGYWFWPFALQQLKESRRAVGLAIVAVLLVFLPFQPAWTDLQGPGQMPGVVMHITELSGRISQYLPVVLRSTLFFFGIVVLAELWRERNRLAIRQAKALVVTAVGLVPLAFSPVIGEKHYLLLLPLLLLLIGPLVRPGKLAVLWLASTALVGVPYYLFWLFLKG